MRKIFPIVITLLLISCSGDDVNPRCNFLLDVNVNTTINLNLPQFNTLNFPGGVAYIPQIANGGIYLYRLNNETIRAWDGADPNLTPQPCSLMTLTGTNVSSSCGEGNEYSLITGGPLGQNPPPCGLRAYNVFPLGNGIYSITD